MRWAASIDGNQPSIVEWARKLGFSVTVTSKLGQGFPDICLGKYGLTFLAEIKDPTRPPSKRKLTTPEQEWHDEWLGHKCIIETADDVVALHDLAKELSAKIKGVFHQEPTRYAEGSVSKCTAKCKKAHA